MVQVSAAAYISTNPDISKALFNATTEIDPAKLRPSQILLQALATPVNPSDVKQIEGSYKAPIRYKKIGQDENEKEVAVGGNEGVFRIVAVGLEVKTYKPGQWAILKLTGFGTWRSYAITEITADNADPLIVVLSDDHQTLSLDDAATISTNPSTAYQLLHQYISDWKEQEWIVVNAGNSFVNKYLFQLTRAQKINTLAVVRDRSDWSEVEKELTALGATKVVKESEFVAPDYVAKTLPNVVGESRVRLALDSLGGPTTPNLVASLSTSGIFVNYGALSGQNVSYSPGVQLAKNITLKSYWLTRNTLSNPQSKVDTVQALLKLYESGTIGPVKFERTEYRTGDNLRDVYVKAIKESSQGKRVVWYVDNI